jgi:hypothetical protein
VITGSAQMGYLWGGWLVAVDASGATLDHPTVGQPTSDYFGWPGKSSLDAVVGVPFSHWPGHVSAAIGTARWEKVGDWPEWAGLDAGNGQLHGTPTAPGTYKVTTRVTDPFDGAGGTFERTVTVREGLRQPDPARIDLTFRTGDYVRTEPFLTPPDTVLGNVSWKVEGTRPPGNFEFYQQGRNLSFFRYNEAPGSYPNITVTATGDGGGTATWIYDVTVLPTLGGGLGGATSCAFAGESFDTGASTLNGVVGTPTVRLTDWYNTPIPYAGGWPSWLKVDAQAGRLYGTVPNDGTGTYTLHYMGSVKDSVDGREAGLGDR